MTKLTNYCLAQEAKNKRRFRTIFVDAYYSDSAPDTGWWGSWGKPLCVGPRTYLVGSTNI